MILNYKKMLILLAACSVLYMAKLTSVSPVYPICAVITIAIASIHRIDARNMPQFIAVQLMLLTVVGFHIFRGGFPIIINLLIGVQVFIFMYSSSNELSKNDVVIISKVFIYAIIITHGIDSIYRIVFPASLSAEVAAAWEDLGISQNKYKMNSLMYGTSNTTAIIILCAMAVAFQLKKFSEIGYMPIIVLTLIMASTFSRASIAAAVVGFAFYKVRMPVFAKTILFGFMAIFSIVSLELIVSFFGVQGDQSFLSKLEILSHLIEYYNNHNTYEHVFGIGFLNSIELLGIYTHNIFLTAFIEGGVFSLALILYVFLIAYRGGQTSSTLVIMITVSALSYVPYLGLISMYFAMGLAVLLDRKYVTSNEK